MKPLLLYILLLGNHGYWLSGQEQSVRVQPNTDAKAPAGAELHWEMALDGVSLGSGRISVDQLLSEKGARVAVPNVRIRTPVDFVYSVRAGDRVLEQGRTPVVLFPTPEALLAELARPMKGKRVCVWGRRVDGDGTAGIARLLESAGIKSDVVSDATKVRLRSPDLLIISPGVLSAGKAVEDLSEEFATGGANVLILSQTSPARPAGHELAERVARTPFDVDAKHPLLAGIERADLDQWLASLKECSAVRLEPDEATLPVIAWPHETETSKPAPTDALLAVRSVGKGRIIWCQTPQADWSQDPRGILLMRNMLEYMLTRPEPTPRPSERRPVPGPPTPTLPPNRIELGQ